MKIWSELLLRTPCYSFAAYDLAHLPAVLKRAEFQTALYLASPGFYECLKAKEFDFCRLLPKEQFTLQKYYNRMSFRPVPFGAFAAVSQVAWGDFRQVQLARLAEVVLHLTPELHYPLDATISPDDELVLASTLYRLGQSFRYYRTHRQDTAPYTFSIDELDAERLTVALVRKLNKETVNFKQLVTWLCEETGGVATAAEQFIRFLCAEQVLQASSQTTVIGAARYRVSTSLQEFTPVQEDLGQPLYAIAQRPCLNGGADAADQPELHAALAALKRLAMPRPDSRLRRFLQDFKAKFDRRQVPLLEALDPDAGVPYGAGLTAVADQSWLKALDGTSPYPPDTNDWGALRQFFLKHWPGSQERTGIHLTKAAVEAFSGQATGQSPPTLAVMFRKTVEGLLLEEVGGATANAMLARFSLFDDDVHQLCKAVHDLEAQANPGVIFADLAFLAQNHVDNVNRRRPVYPVEIGVNVPSQDVTRQLPVSDLMLSVRGDQLLLYSKSLKSQIIPRLASAYNYHRLEMPIVALLGDLQYQGLRHRWTLDLEQLFPGLPYYPRVSFEDSILTTAKWRLAETTVTGDPHAFVKQLRKQLGLPQWVTLGGTDQQLVFDLGRAEDREFFADCLKKEKQPTLREYLLPDRSVRGAQEPLAGQYVAICYHDQPVYPPVSPARLNQTKDRHRRFLPGSDWLYLKLYIRPEQADLILNQLIAPFIHNYRQRLRTWFFIRYQDPDFHLRLRLQVKNGDPANLLAAFHQRLKRSGLEPLVRDMKLATYERELERYPLKFIHEIEQTFQASSDTALQSIQTTEQEERLILIMTAVLDLLATFIPDHPSQQRFCAASAAGFLKEKADLPAARRGLDQEYRRLAVTLRQKLPPPAQKTHATALTSSMRLLQKKLAGRPLQEQHTLLADLIHLHVNRGFADRQRDHELVIYYLLSKYITAIMKY